MKKFLAFILAMIMVLSFAGCGKSTAELEELLVSEKWVSVYDSSYTKEFDADTTGYSKSGGSAGPFNWEAIDAGSFEISFSSGTVVKYLVSEQNGFITLSDSDHVYVKESNFEEARKIWDFPDDITRGTITNNKDKIEILTPGELGEIYDKNRVKFDDMYFGAYATVIGIVIEIEENMITIGGGAFNCWEVYNCSSADVRMFDIGDVVIATGTIRDAFVGQVELVGDTTIEHYNG